MARTTAYDRVQYAGVVLDKMTLQAFLKADAKMYRDTGKHLILVQGSYNAGGVAASAGTHDGGGALDVSIRNLTKREVIHAIKCLRYYGFTAEHRYSPPFSGPHIHGIQIGNARVAAGAAFQVAEYRAGRSGLASRGAGTVMGYRPTKAYRYVEPAPAKRTAGVIDQLWHVRGDDVARFRPKPSTSAPIVARHTDGTWRFDRWQVVGKTKWLRTDKTKRWVPAHDMTKGRG